MKALGTWAYALAVVAAYGWMIQTDATAMHGRPEWARIGMFTLWTGAALIMLLPVLFPRE